MCKTITVNPQTIYVVDYLRDYIARSEGNPRRQSRLVTQASFSRNIDLEIIRHELLYLNEVLPRFEFREKLPIFLGESPDDWQWLTYDQDIEIIPIYSDAVALTQKKLIVRPSEIPNILAFIVITKTTGVDIETHGFGYHFHFGSISRNRLSRSDLLFTFNPTDHDASGHPKPNVPLHSEKHGGNYKRVDVSTIGLNKRRPIYDVCHTEMLKRGINNFKQPSSNSSVFYP